MKTLLKYLAYVIIISSFFRIIPVIAAVFYNESPVNFVFTFLLSLGLGFLILKIEKKMEGKAEPLSLTQGLMLVALSFIILSLIGMISFLPSFGYNFINALFESVSGFTTTGLTLYSSLDSLPKSLLLWRAETQWIGGIGIIMVFLFILSRLKAHTYSRVGEAESKIETTVSLYQAQGFPQKLEQNFKKTITNIMIVYSGYTVIGLALLFAAGMPFFDSIAMSFTSLSTGGFAVTDAFYSNSLQLFILSALMILGSISFIAHNRLLQKNIRGFLSSFEKNVFFIMIIASILIVFAAYRDIGVVAFQLVSAFTTTGYSIAPIHLLPQIFILFIMAGMIIGGGIASTSGGIKVFRFYYILKSIPWVLKKLSLPANAVIPFKIKGMEVEEKSLLMIVLFVFCYLLVLFAGTVVFMLFGHSFLNSSFQIVSALGTVGMQTMELAGINWLCKTVLIIAMLLGRLEIFPLLVLVRKLFVK